MENRLQVAWFPSSARREEEPWLTPKEASVKAYALQARRKDHYRSDGWRGRGRRRSWERVRPPWKR